MNKDLALWSFKEIRQMQFDVRTSEEGGELSVDEL